MNLAEFKPWDHQTFALSEIPRRIEAGERKICLTTPTGGGKSFVACKLLEWAVEEKRWKAVIYTNRRLLIEQLSRVLTDHGIKFGVRAAGYDDHRYKDVQISSLPTEGSRVLRSEEWALHGEGKKVLAIVDEAHLQRGEQASKILAMHHESGGAYLGLTATPIGLKGLYDSLVVAGKPSELRACGCLVPAYHVGPDEPDMKNFKQNVKTGEFTEGDVRKAIMTKCVFARVHEYYKILNPDRRPTILFGPGVAESMWFAQELTKAGMRAAHIDGEGVWIDGEYSRSIDRDEILREVRKGKAILCNRYVAREGIDLPEVSHLILATVMGSLQTYLQSAGRGLRASPGSGKTRLTIQDHGAHWWRHGSVNADREWVLDCTESKIKEFHSEKHTNKKTEEPIRCPFCSFIRARGPKCPMCGKESSKKTRIVIQQDGRLIEYHGDIFKPRKTSMKSDTVKKWEQCYYRAKKSKNRMTFKQAEGLFYRENNYWPPRDELPLMPINRVDWSMPVADVPYNRLTRLEQP